MESLACGSSFLLNSSIALPGRGERRAPASIGFLIQVFHSWEYTGKLKTSNRNAQRQRRVSLTENTLVVDAHPARAPHGTLACAHSCAWELQNLLQKRNGSHSGSRGKSTPRWAGAWSFPTEGEEAALGWTRRAWTAISTYDRTWLRESHKLFVKYPCPKKPRNYSRVLRHGGPWESVTFN